MRTWVRFQVALNHHRKIRKVTALQEQGVCEVLSVVCKIYFADELGTRQYFARRMPIQSKNNAYATPIAWRPP